MHRSKPCRSVPDGVEVGSARGRLLQAQCGNVVLHFRHRLMIQTRGGTGLNQPHPFICNNASTSGEIPLPQGHSNKFVRSTCRKTYFHTGQGLDSRRALHQTVMLGEWDWSPGTAASPWSPILARARPCLKEKEKVVGAGPRKGQSPGHRTPAPQPAEESQPLWAHLGSAGSSNGCGRLGGLRGTLKSKQSEGPECVSSREPVPVSGFSGSPGSKGGGSRHCREAS